MELDSLKRVLIRELDDFYTAVDRVQDRQVHMTETDRPGEQRVEFDLCLELMRDLGCRLERLFFLINGEPLRFVCKSWNEIRAEISERTDSNYSNAP